MRFAIAAGDQYLGVFETLVHAGWKPLKLFSMPEDHRRVAAFARRQNAAIQLSRITERDMLELREQGCDALIVACYNWRIGDWRPFLKYAVNFHCSPLPNGRGPYPIHRAILENRGSWAVTCHRLVAELDAGDILAGENFPLQPDECHESLNLKIQMAGKRLAVRISRDFETLWDQATPQDEGSYWPLNTIEERIIDFQQPVESIMRHIRAFGDTESLAHVNAAWLGVKRALGWPERHGHTPGTVAHIHDRAIVVAAEDGYIALLEWEMARPDIVSVLTTMDRIISSNLDALLSTG